MLNIDYKCEYQNRTRQNIIITYEFLSAFINAVVQWLVDLHERHLSVFRTLELQGDLQLKLVWDVLRSHREQASDSLLFPDPGCWA